MGPEELRKAWENFTQNNYFKLNPDRRHVDFIIQGVLGNEKNYGLKLCPCRLRNGKRERDLELICPCNFKTHETWLNPRKNMIPMCWCGLFVKK